jgi:hypothetical protein
MQRQTPIDWNRVQAVKRDCLELAARHAMEQQKRDQRPTVPIPFPDAVTDSRQMKVLAKTPDSLQIAITDVLTPYGEAMEDRVRFRLPAP